MPAATYDLVIESATDWSVPIRLWTDASKTTRLDITGYTLAATIKGNYSASPGFTQAITCTVTDASEGEFTLSLNDTETSALEAQLPAGIADGTRDGVIGVWDMTLTLSGVTTREIQGSVTLSRNVS